MGFLSGKRLFAERVARFFFMSITSYKYILSSLECLIKLEAATIKEDDYFSSLLGKGNGRGKKK